jgi:hypothetical protein
MFSPFSVDTAPTRPHESEVRRPERTAPRFTFRPPNLGEVEVVADPFERAGPRLRIMEYFSRELD